MADPASSRRDGWTGRSGAILSPLWALCAFWALHAATPAWALGTFTRHLTITIGAGVVVAGPHPNFPVLVDVSNLELRTAGSGGQVLSPNGYDIVFRGEDDGICGGVGTSPCMLDHEIELYDGGTGRVLAWGRVPSLANGARSGADKWRAREARRRHPRRPGSLRRERPHARADQRLPAPRGPGFEDQIEGTKALGTPG